jgi:hypothetical protein
MKTEVKENCKDANNTIGNIIRRGVLVSVNLNVLVDGYKGRGDPNRTLPKREGNFILAPIKRK